MTTPPLKSSPVIVYSDDQAFIALLTDSSNVFATSSSKILFAFAEEQPTSPILVDLALQAKRCDQCIYMTLAKLIDRDPQRLMLAVQSGQDSHFLHEGVFYHVLDKQDFQKDPKSILALIHTQAALRRAHGATSMMLARSNREHPSEDTDELETLKLSKARWKAAWIKAEKECHQIALDTLGQIPLETPSDLNPDQLPAYWMRITIIQLQAEISHLKITR